MSKLTNNIGGSANNEAPKSGVDFYLSFYKQKQGGNYFDVAKRETHEREEITGRFQWLGHYVRYEGQSQRHGVNLYSTAFESAGDSIEIRVRPLEGDNKKPVLVYTGRANDQSAKEKANFYEARYTISLLLINEKGKLVIAKIDGMNLGRYFDFCREHGEANYLEITGQTEEANPKKPKETVWLVDFKPVSDLDFKFSIEGADRADLKSKNLKAHLDHILHYARTGSYPDANGEGISPAPAPGTPKGTGDSVPASAATEDDDLPF